MLENLPIASWQQRLSELAVSREMLEGLVLQLALIAVIFLVAWALHAATRTLTDRLAERVRNLVRNGRLLVGLRGLAVMAYAWVLLLLIERLGHRFGIALTLVGIAATLTALWIVLRASSLVFRDPVSARLIVTVAWVIAALDITGLLAPTAAALDSAALTVGTVRLSLLLVVKSVLVVALLLWAALGLARIIGTRLQRFTGLSPSVQALTRNVVKIVLVSLALLIGLNTVGIDLTAFAVFSGAVGVGLGFGLQKIISNFVSGIILLVERSIKPGDVIEVGHTYGLVTALGARYASVRGRDGKEYLIPNETLITNQVTNWSYTSSLLRLDAPFGVSYDSDLHQVRELAIAAAGMTRRVLAEPPPVCHVTAFAENAVDLLLRFWIEDPANGVKNVLSEVYLALWDSFREHGVELPYPQREIRFRELPGRGDGAGLSQRLAERSAAE